MMYSLTDILIPFRIVDSGPFLEWLAEKHKVRAMVFYPFFWHTTWSIIIIVAWLTNGRASTARPLACVKGTGYTQICTLKILFVFDKACRCPNTAASLPYEKLSFLLVLMAPGLWRNA